MPVILPLQPSVGTYRFRSVLQTVEYGFRMRWNSRDSSWYLDVREADQTPIALGLRVVLGAYLGRVSTHFIFRNGALVARVPHGDDRREAGFDDMGTRVQLWYFDRAEVIQEMQWAALGRPSQ